MKISSNFDGGNIRVIDGQSTLDALACVMKKL